MSHGVHGSINNQEEKKFNTNIIGLRDIPSILHFINTMISCLLIGRKCTNQRQCPTNSYDMPKKVLSAPIDGGKQQQYVSEIDILSRLVKPSNNN
jgi:hypothetical protein